MNLERLKILLDGMTPDGVDCLSAPVEFGNGYAIEVESAIFLYGLVRRYKPKIVVETGTHWGFSSAWIAAALADNWETYKGMPKGQLYTIDVNSYDQRGEQLWNRLGVESFVNHIIGDSRTLQFIPPSACDVLYLDADHEAAAVIAEWNQLARSLNPSAALVIFHDSRLDVREAEAIAKRGREHARRYHTTQARAEYFLEITERCIRGMPPTLEEALHMSLESHER